MITICLFMIVRIISAFCSFQQNLNQYEHAHHPHDQHHPVPPVPTFPHYATPPPIPTRTSTSTLESTRPPKFNMESVRRGLVRVGREIDNCEGGRRRQRWRGATRIWRIKLKQKITKKMLFVIKNRLILRQS